MEVAEELALIYPTWFFELYASFDDHPLVLEDYQTKYLLDDSTFTITNKTRQAGGSLMISMKKFYRMMRQTGYRCDIVSINLKEAVSKITDIKKLYDSLPAKWQIPFEKKNELSIAFNKGARLSEINSMAASSGIRGSKKDIVFDEFAHIMKAEDLFYAAAPAIMNGSLTLDVLSTPAGKQSYFSQIWHNDPMPDGTRPFSVFNRHEFIWCDVRRFVTDYEHAQHLWHQEYQRNMVYMPELVQEVGNEKIKFFYHLLPWAQFQQEFCGVFLDESNAFFTAELVNACLKGDVGSADDGMNGVYEDCLEKWTHRPEDNDNPVYMGVDFGESEEDTDKTSIQILELLPNGRMMHRYSEVLDAAKLPGLGEQAHHIAHVAKLFRPDVLSTDDTGLGRGVNPLLREINKSLPLEPVNFNRQSKEEMVMKVKTLMEKGLLWLQADDRALHGQIRGLQRTIGDGGGFKYSGKPHDDMFWALALAARKGGYKEFAMYTLGGGYR